MKQKGSIAIELLVMVVSVVVTSVVILVLINMGVISVSAQEEVDVLNTEFLPFGRQGSLQVRDFAFCSDVDANFNCLNPKNVFKLGEEIVFRFVVDSEPFNGEVILVENYQVRNPQGEVILDIEGKYNQHYTKRTNTLERVPFFESFFVNDANLADESFGKYTVVLVVENALLQKRASVVETFSIVRGER